MNRHEIEMGDQPHAPATLSLGKSRRYPSDWKLGGPYTRPRNLGEEKICSSQSLIRNYVKGTMRCVVWSNLPPFVPNNRKEARNSFVRFAGTLFEIWTKEILNMTAGVLSTRYLSEFRNMMLDEAWLWPVKRFATRQTWSTLRDRKNHDNLREVWFQPKPWQVSVKYGMFPFIECTEKKGLGYLPKDFSARTFTFKCLNTLHERVLHVKTVRKLNVTLRQKVASFWV